jgi:hypothetical protein
MVMGQSNILDSYKWKNRLLIMYSSDTESELVEIQEQHFRSEKDAYAERDLIVFILTDSSFTNLNQKDAKMDVAINALKVHLPINDNDTFKVFLIGKDGGIKIDSDKPLSNNTIFGTIDAMPMRRNEMRKEN